jgi:hypothetical protein
MKSKRPVGYILRDHKALPVYDIIEWALWFEDADRQVAYTEFINPPHWQEIDNARARDHAAKMKELGFQPRNARSTRMIVVSTVFLGLDHAWAGGPPLLFETMVFNGPLNDEQRRCATWDQATAQHRKTVEEVGRALESDARSLSDDLPATHGR